MNDSSRYIAISSGDTYVAVPGKKKFPIKIVLVIFAGAAAVIGILAAVIIPKILNPAPENASQAFNLYSNYVLYGKKSTEELDGEYARTTVYWVDKILDGNDRASFYIEAESLFGVFMEKYGALAVDTEEKMELNYVVESHRELLDFAQKYAETTELTDGLVSDKYLEGGETAAREYIYGNYQTLAESSNEKIKQYGELKLEQFESLIGALNGYREGGCIKGSKADEACISDFGQSGGPVQESYSKFYEIRYMTEQLASANRDDWLRGCWTISAAVAGMAGK